MGKQNKQAMGNPLSNFHIPLLSRSLILSQLAINACSFSDNIRQK